MPEQNNGEENDRWLLTSVTAHFLERLDKLNYILGEIEDRLRGIEQRLSYAKVLDSDD